MTDTPDDDFAAEYVLGVLELSERAAAEARLKTDAGFAALVNDWQNRLSGLNDDYAEVPAPNLLPQIEARLFPVAAKPARSWFGWLAGAGAVAALLVVFALPQPQAPLLATVAGDGLSYEARYDGATLTLHRIAGSPAPEGKVHELWIIAPGAAPLSLGLLADADLTVTTQAPKGWTLAVTLEPAGGAPGGIPSGPVVAAVEIGV
jgi:anti-sigma-K factor RskA